MFDIPVTVSIAYADGTSEDVIVKLTDRDVRADDPAEGARPERGGEQGRRIARGSPALAPVDPPHPLYDR